MQNLIYIPNLSIGNTNSVINMIQKINGKVILIDKPNDLLDAKKIILPGVGSFDHGMNELRENGWDVVLQKLVIDQNVPILGICLGMQLFFNDSEEGKLSGLGWVDGSVKKIKISENKAIKIPHMGWNNISIKRNNSLIQNNTTVQNRFYFVHSYYANCNDYDDIVATTFHGSEITAAIIKNNIYGVQFHPEKSHKFGLNLLKNFLNI